MLKKVGNGFQTQLIHVFRLLPLGVERALLVNRHGQHFAIFTGFVRHLQNTNRAAGHHNAGNQGYRRDHQHVHRVAVTAQRLGNIAVVGRVVHGRAHETVHKQRAGLFVHFVLHGVGIHRNFDDHIEGLWNVLTRGDFG